MNIILTFNQQVLKRRDNMKKIMSLILTAALAVGCLVGCGSTPDNNNANNAGTESAQGDVAGTNNDSEYKIANDY